jgi:hypothetical protein
MSYQAISGAVATGLALVGTLPYIWDVLQHKTKPHVFTWLVWSLLSIIALLGQITGGGGPGILIVAITTLCTVTVLLLALKKGQRSITFLDWVSLTGALVALGLWFIVKNPVLSILLVIVTDALGFFPTIRKSWAKPYEETLSAYVMADIKQALTILAVSHVSILTVGYSSYLIIANSLLVSVLLIRRQKIKKT